MPDYNRMAENSRNLAKHLLAHYFKLLFDSQGLRWDYDNQAEIESIVDEIIESIRAEIKAEAQDEANEKHEYN